jgi:putative salt-induced outer membrane protein YdiY
MYNTVRIIKNMASMVRIPFKGGLLGGLVALGAGYATQAATEAVIGIFSGESSLSSASWKMGEKQEQLYSLMMNASNSKVFDKSEEMRYKYGIVNDYILG